MVNVPYVFFSIAFIILTISVEGKIERAENFHKKLLLYLQLDSEIVNPYRGIWSEIDQKDSDIKREERVYTVIALDSVFVIDNNRILIRSHNDEEFRDALKNSEEPSTRQNQNIIFVKQFEWKTVLYMLVCYEDDLCSLYTGSKITENNAVLEHRHDIRLDQSRDAIFFSLANQLYLLIPGNDDILPMTSTIYNWAGTYMDTLEHNFGRLETGGVSVAAFEYKQSTIIVLAQNSKYKSCIEIFQFKRNDVQKKHTFIINEPTAVYHYSQNGQDYILVISKDEPSTVFWWDGLEMQLVLWVKLPEIDSSCLLRIVNIGLNTFFFCANNNTVQVYIVGQFSNRIVPVFEKLYLEVGENVIDLCVWPILNDSIVSILLTIENEKTYYIKSWNLSLDKKNNDGHLIAEEETPIECFFNLMESLKEKMAVIEQLYNSWVTLLDYSESLTLSENISLNSLILESGIINEVDSDYFKSLLNEDNEQQILNVLKKDIDEIRSASKKLLRLNGKTLSGDFVIQEAHIDNLYLDSVYVDKFNGMDMKLSINSLTDTDNFPMKLKEENVIIHNLEISEICGIPFKYWAQKNDMDGIFFDTKNNTVIVNDTIFISSNFSRKNVTIEQLNDLVIDDFFHSLFIINKNQNITGNLIYNGLLQIENLTTVLINNDSVKNFMIYDSEQNFTGSFKGKNIKIKNLHVESINYVKVDNVARIDKENVIRGKVILKNINVTEKLIFPPNYEYERINPVQIYDDVIIYGNVNVSNVEFNPVSLFELNSTKTSVNSIIDSFWLKSKDQKITNNIIFNNNITVDNLDFQYMNRFASEDFLYTDAKQIPEKFFNLHFSTILSNKSLTANKENNIIFNSTGESLIIYDKIYIPHLFTKNLLCNSFNGLEVEKILNNEGFLNISKPMNFNTIIVDKIVIEDCNANFMNRKNLSEYFDNLLYLDRNYNLDLMKSSYFSAENIVIERFNNTNSSELFNSRKSINPTLKTLLIEGDLTVHNYINVSNYINKLEPKEYLNQLSAQDIEVPMDFFENLTVKNVNMTFLNGIKVEQLYNEVMSKTKPQSISSQPSYHKIVANISLNSINNHTLSNLNWVDSPIYIRNDVTFIALDVKQDIWTTYLNNQTIIELKDQFNSIPMKKISYMEIKGPISWELNSKYSSLRQSSVSFLYNNSLTTNTYQTVDGETIFENDISSSIVDGNLENIEKIKEVKDIVNDAVVDDRNTSKTDTFTIKVTGHKKLKLGFTANSASVFDDIGTNVVNGRDIRNFSSSIFRLNFDKFIGGTIVFKEHIKINKLLTNSTIHNTSIDQLVSTKDILPNNLIFKKLIVLQEALVENIDNITVDEFFNKRVTLDANNDIYANVQFNGPIIISDHAYVTNFDNIHIDEFVFSDTSKSQNISGRKFFTNDIIVEGDMYINYINDINITEEYNNGVLNDDDTEIFGDLVFEERFSSTGNVNVLQADNEFNITSLIEGRETLYNEFEDFLSAKRTETDIMISRYANISANLKNILLYFEEEDKLRVQVPNVEKVKVLNTKSVTKLFMFSREPGQVCGLPEDCYCPSQYVTNFMFNDCQSWKNNGTEVMYDFYEPDDAFGIKIITNSISSSIHCRSPNLQNEYTRILWTMPNETNNEIILSDKIIGYVKDSSVITYNNKAYIVLAIYYNISSESHETRSQIYEFDIENQNLTLYKEIDTNAAYDVEVFKISTQSAPYVLFGCYGNLSLSLLYRLDIKNTEFVDVRTFDYRSRYVTSMKQNSNHFVFLDDADANAVHIFYYNSEYDNYYEYQSFFYDAQVVGMETFHIGDYGNSDAFLLVATEDGLIHIYEYKFAEKFQKKATNWLEGVKSILPYYHKGHRYIFAGTNRNSNIYRIIHQGPY